MPAFCIKQVSVISNKTCTVSACRQQIISLSLKFFLVVIISLVCFDKLSIIHPIIIVNIIYNLVYKIDKLKYKYILNATYKRKDIMVEQKEIKAKTKSSYKREYDTLFFNPRFVKASECVERRGYWVSTITLKVTK